MPCVVLRHVDIAAAPFNARFFVTPGLDCTVEFASAWAVNLHSLW